MDDATGEAEGSGLRVAFDHRLKLEFHGATVTSDAGLLAFRELDDALGLTVMAAEVLADTRTGRNGRHSLIAQLRQSVFGRLAGYEDVNDADRLRTAYNGHFACTCYHPLLVFNQDGDLERCALRPGNVHSAHGWREVLDPVVARYRGWALRRLLRGDAAFALPDVYEYLEAEGFQYAIRLPANQVRLNRIAH